MMSHMACFQLWHPGLVFHFTVALQWKRVLLTPSFPPTSYLPNQKLVFLGLEHF